MAAGFSTDFDWGELFDFRERGGLPLTNFLLSWLLFLLFLGSAVWLCTGGFRWRNLAAAAGIAGVCCLGLLCFPAGGAPRVRDGVLFPPGAADGRMLVLLPAGMALKDAAVFLARHGCDDWRLPLSSRLSEQPPGGEVIMFGSAAEYAGQYADGRLLFVAAAVRLSAGILHAAGADGKAVSAAFPARIFPRSAGERAGDSGRAVLKINS